MVFHGYSLISLPLQVSRPSYSRVLLLFFRYWKR